MGCTNCPFQGQPQVPSEGDPGTCKYVIVGEAPAHDEIRSGRPFTGATGRGLAAFMAKAGMKREECFITNALLCQVPKSKAGMAQAVVECRSRLIEELNSINPEAHIALLGRTARDALFVGLRQKGILATRGWHKWKGRDVFVSAHPSYVVLYNPDEAPLLIKDLARIKRGRLPPIGPFRVEPYRFGQFALPGLDDEYLAQVIDTPLALEHFISALEDGSIEVGRYTAFDLETDQVDFQRDRILCMSISTKPGRAYVIPDSLLYEDGHTFVTTHWTKQNWEDFFTDKRYRTGSYLRPSKWATKMLGRLFQIDTIWTGHNMKFDLRFLKGQLDVTVPWKVRRLADTILMHYALDERGKGHGLKAVADDYYDVGDYEEGLFDYIAKKSGRYSKVPRDVLYRYNTMDTECTLNLAYDMEEELRQQGLFERPFRYPIMEAVPMLLDAELRGININWDGLVELEQETIYPELDRLETELRDISGHPDLNPLSSQRVIKIMYDEMDFPVIKVRTRAAGKRIEKRSTQIAVMDGWDKMRKRGQLRVSETSWEFAEKLREYRHVRKMQGSYVRKWRRYKGTDDRVHPAYWLRGTVTGRLSAKDPPIQTIPSKVGEDPLGRAVADVHVPADGHKLLYADYSQAELMAIACESGDQFMLKTFNEGADYHDEVAIAAFGSDFSKDDRQACKRLTYGWAYGGNVYEIATNALQFEGDVAQRFAEEWDRLFHQAVAWRKAQGQKMIEQGYVESATGRRRRYHFLTRANVGKAQRVAMNAPIQSIISDFTLISAIRLWQIYRNDPEVHVILLIHDSLVLEVKEHRIPEVSAKMHEVMVDVPREFYTQLTFKADVKVGEHLGELT